MHRVVANSSTEVVLEYKDWVLHGHTSIPCLVPIPSRDHYDMKVYTLLFLVTSKHRGEVQAFLEQDPAAAAKRTQAVE